MASEADMLRKVAAELREQAARVERERMEKTARVIQAATALESLRRKVRNHDV